MPWRLRWYCCFVLDRRNNALMIVANTTHVKERITVMIVQNVPAVVVLRGSLVTRCAFCVLRLHAFLLQPMVVRQYSWCCFSLFSWLLLLLLAFVSHWCSLCLVLCVCFITEVKNSSTLFSSDWYSYRRREDEGCTPCEYSMSDALQIKNVACRGDTTQFERAKLQPAPSLLP